MRQHVEWLRNKCSIFGLCNAAHDPGCQRLIYLHATTRMLPALSCRLYTPGLTQVLSRRTIMSEDEVRFHDPRDDTITGIELERRCGPWAHQLWGLALYFPSIWPCLTC